MMTITEAKAKFEFLLSQQKDTKSPQAIVSVMLDFYRNERAEDCILEEDGDMLLYQWGTYDWGQGRWFAFNITRQFIPSGGKDDDIFQLSVTAMYTPSPELDAMKSGNRWCGSLDELDSFEQFVASSEAMIQIGATNCDELEVHDGCAG